MVSPTLWGPVTWNVLFTIAVHARREDNDDLTRLYLDFLPLLLPCRLCRRHLRVNREEVLTKVGGQLPTTPRKWFEWLYHLKDTVNASMKPPVPSIDLKDLEERFEFFGSVIDETMLASVLVLYAREARALKRDDIFLAFCHTLARLCDSVLTKTFCTGLQNMCRPIIRNAHQLASAVRTAYGFTALPLRHYELD